MQRLTNLDASFLRLEGDGSPMHIGGTMIFDRPADGPMTRARLERHISARLSTSRVFRERLLWPASPLENPRWIADHPVDLAQHITRASVPAPLDLAALTALRERFFAGPLPRDRPLWSLLYVEERPSRAGTGRFALLLKVHHAAVDGVSAEHVLAGLLDPGVRPRATDAALPAPEATPAPSSLVQDLRSAAQGAPLRELANRLTGLGLRYAKRLRNPVERALPDYFGAPRTPFNAPIDARRNFPAAHLPLPLLQQVRQAVPDAKLNDVVLAVCAGALRRYLLTHAALPDAPLVAMVPVSKRAADQKGQQGNQVSSLLVSLATDGTDPLARLARITAGTRAAKGYNRDMPLEALYDRLPAGGPALFLAAWRRLNLSRHAPPLFNTVVTNVPGSPVPLYLDGARMLSLTGMVGIYDGVGLAFVVTSYVDTLSIGITSTPSLLPDPDDLVECLHASLRELADAAGARQPGPEPSPRAVA